MARIEFLDTPATQEAGVAGRVVGLSPIPTMGAMARAQIHFDVTDADKVPSAGRLIAVLYDALIWAGAKVSFAQAAEMRDSTGIPPGSAIQGDYRVTIEDGDPEPPKGEDDGTSGERPTGPGVAPARVLPEAPPMSAQYSPGH